MLPDSQQAVLFDKNRGAHVMVEVGTRVAGYIVDDISEDEVTLSGNGRQVVLTAPADVKPEASAKSDERKPSAKPDERKPDPSATTAVPDPYSAAPADPYSDEAAADPASDPAAAPTTVPTTAPPTTTITAPTTIPTTTAPTTTAPTTTAPTTTAPTTTAPTTTAPTGGTAKPTVGPATPATPATYIGPVMPPATGPAPNANPDLVLSRVEVDAALGDFGGLLSSVRGELTPAGARIDHVLAGSMLAKATLRVGDVVVSVDGKPLRSLDDAADLYARASTARVVTMQVLRGGRPTTIKLVIR